MHHRAFEHPDGRISIVGAAPKARLEGESDSDFIERIMARTIESQRDPDTGVSPLDGLPTFDVDPANLPARTQVDAQGDECPCRDAWRKDGENVVVDDANGEPNWGALSQRLKKVIPLAKRVGLAAEFGLLETAIIEHDAGTIQAIYDVIKNKQSGGAAPLTTAQFGDFRATMTAKNIPVDL
jgi:hypothetical protein